MLRNIAVALIGATHVLALNLDASYNMPTQPIQEEPLSFRMAGASERIPCYGSWLCRNYRAPKAAVTQTEAIETSPFMNLPESQDEMISELEGSLEDSSASVDSVDNAVANMSFTWAPVVTHKVRRERKPRSRQ